MSKRISDVAKHAETPAWRPGHHLCEFGDREDGVIEIVTTVAQSKNPAEIGRSEAGCYYGEKTHPHYPVFAVSVATGCRFPCAMCNVRKQPGSPLTPEEIVQQTMLIIREAYTRGVEVDGPSGVKINIGKTGEPLDNEALPEAMEKLLQGLESVRYKVATVFPKGKRALHILRRIAEFSARYAVITQMQISLHSTSEQWRRCIAGTAAASFAEISAAAQEWREYNIPRKQWNLNLILAEQTPCDPDDIIHIFPPEHFQIRPRDCIMTEEAVIAGLTSISEDRHEQVCASLRAAGYTVNLAARPTSTEKKNRLAANATRYRTLDR